MIAVKCALNFEMQCFMSTMSCVESQSSCYIALCPIVVCLKTSDTYCHEQELLMQVHLLLSGRIILRCLMPFRFPVNYISSGSYLGIHAYIDLFEYTFFYKKHEA